MVRNFLGQGNGGPIDWPAVNREILDGLDLETEYRALGVVFTGSRASSKGWLQCHARDREDTHASAAVNVGSGDLRGRYKDMGGELLSLNLWEFAARFGPYQDWKAARLHYARQANVKLPSGGHEPKRPARALDFISFHKAIVRQWCRAKGGITVQAVEEAGGRLANWPKRSPLNFRQSVIAFPGYGPHGVEEDPVGWYIVDDNGGMIRKYDGKGKPPQLLKVMTVAGSEPALVNRWAVGRLPQAKVVFKVEGLTDMLCLHSALSYLPEIRDTHVVITNGCGCQEGVQNDWVRKLAGKDVRIVGDADVPGQLGAEKWYDYLDRVTPTRKVVLPYPVAKNHGKDVRDLLRDHAAGVLS